MTSFLKDMYRTWPQVTGDDATPGFEGPTDEGLQGISSECYIGFSYGSPPGVEREYVFALVRWISIQIGRRKSVFRNENLNLEVPVPYWVYDGLEAFPVLLDKDHDWSADLDGFRFDRFGLPEGDMLARELAWYHIPDGTHTTITATHQGRSGDEIREAFIQAGLPGAWEVVKLLQAELARLDVLWGDRATQTLR